MYVCVHAGRYGWMHEWLAGWLDGWMHACMHAWMGGWVDGWMYMGRGNARTSLGVFVLNLGCRTAFLPAFARNFTEASHRGSMVSTGC